MPPDNAQGDASAEIAGELLKCRAEARLRHVAVQHWQPAISDQALQEAPTGHRSAHKVLPGSLVCFRVEENGRQRRLWHGVSYLLVKREWFSAGGLPVNNVRAKT